MNPNNLTYYYDRMRHLICQPYSIKNLHIMAEDLGIKPHWYHNKDGKAHYDIPVRMIEKIQSRCLKITPKQLLTIIIEGNGL